MVDAWRIVVLDDSNTVLGTVNGWRSLEVVLRWRAPGSWVLSGAASSGLDVLGAGTRVAIYRRPEGLAEQLVCVGAVDRIETTNTAEGAQVTASGTDVLGWLSRRIVLPNPASASSSQSSAARYTDSGPAGYVIHRMVTVQAGMGAQHVRQSLDSRVGEQQGADLGKGASGWSDSSTGTVSWSGQVASLSASSAVTLFTTNAIEMSDAMVTAVADVTLSGFMTCTVTAITNTTAAGAAFGQAGAQSYSFTQVQPAGLSGAGARTFVADVFRRRVAGHDWVRLYFGFETGADAETVEIHGGGVWMADAEGATVQASSRFDNLAEAVESLAVAGGVRLVGDMVDARPRVSVSAPTDNTGDIRFSTALGNVTSWTTVLAAPRSTRVLVGGSGEGTARVLRERSNSTAETEWSQRRETFRDARDAGDNATLDQRGDELLLENAATAGYAVEIIDRRGMAFGADYQVGDQVSLNVAGVVLTDYIAAVELKADEQGTTVTPVLASSLLADNTPEIYQRVRRIGEAVAGLERRT